MDGSTFGTLYCLLIARTQDPDLDIGIGAYGHARQTAMAELSGSQPSGPTQSLLFNPGGPCPPKKEIWLPVTQRRSWCG